MLMTMRMMTMTKESNADSGFKIQLEEDGSSSSTRNSGFRKVVSVSL